MKLETESRVRGGGAGLRSLGDMPATLLRSRRLVRRADALGLVPV
jgi:hypothetical protein